MSKKFIKVNDVMLNIGKFPISNTNDFLKDSIDLMDKYRLGIICVVDEHNKLFGILTDGDLRRNLTNVQKPLASYFFALSIKDTALSYSVLTLLELLSLDPAARALAVKKDDKIKVKKIFLII